MAHVATRLKRKGWEPTVFAMSPGGPLTRVLVEGEVPVYGFCPPKWLNRTLKNKRLNAYVRLVGTWIMLVWLLWKIRPTIVHFFLPAAYIVGAIASIFSPVPFRIMSRRSLNYYQMKRPVLARIERFLHKRMTAICGNSQAVIKDLIAEGVENSKLRLIYNGIDFRSFTSDLSKAEQKKIQGIAPNTLVFVIVANLIPYKGHFDLIDAFTIIKDKLPPAWLLICLGRDDGIQKELVTRIQLAGIEQHVKFFGSRSDVADFLRLSDVGILCSHEEGFSNAVLEGMAAGLPMIVTDVGGNAEAVIDDTTGYVVSAKSPVELGRALLRVCDSSTRERLGNAGRKRVVENFSLEECIMRYEELYIGLRASRDI